MSFSDWQLRQACHALQEDGVIAYPTEAIFGVGCDPWSETAIIKLLALKRRPLEKGLILIAADFNQLQDFIQPLSAELLAKVNQTWPGPTTWLLPVRESISPLLTGGRQTLAVRVTAHPLAAELSRRFGGPLVSSSANITGLRPARNVHQVHWQLPELDYVLPGALGGATKPSTIRDALTDEVLR
ncbi:MULTISPECIES: Sua5/YciO/YrdC/YwlC family protein [unclassified Methylophaga]|jgi:L-threonylcarbamoyladenylate synthase|uniref:L-threonylcarbamoyladenylate synthase n=1 Tax=unclassified Methylophaga TaxID=2629249 RepID=UPI000C8EB748|nr:MULTISPECIES: Sua5/YciO/YrdC/YwlC family protein [unclassified Methylophaga]MAK66198.1 tRNA threonylcarbamoyladenosine biosynthesis protein RimN [Methylophaga sp.]MAY17393.1 tRNA threonylcarbamoyladenosine biosynthesis protein RimN [Methylophaga sp.]MBN47335.1 tRNA threonylcarbamoyladenosine biosynthesis protein RimN [Methylophaga sp.]HAO24349.1 tRNA threonylcarbamoyladenosine biosynthesis protein RimN [Methylophaga sp.]HCD04113.1 tRNA threonylcarbamoyladenosine biosynthesis protein RimN [M|tara:strand:- start:3168 stop:3722 length:555 start_codon:yes stop_codon:yes gene_type:complete